MKSYELFFFMPRTWAAEILEYVALEDRDIYKAVVETVAQTRKVRPVFLQRMSRDRRYEQIVETLARPTLDTMAENLLRTWLLKKHNQMLKDFLEGLGIEHKDGTVENLPESVEDATLQLAVEGILSKHQPPAVAVYLHAFNHVNGTQWRNLDMLLQSEARLQLA